MNWSRLAAIRTFVLVIVGLALLSVGAFLWLVPVGYAVAGVALLLLAYLTDAEGVKR